MAKANSTPRSGIPAVAYVRRSTNRQEKSLEDQRREIERYAAEHGFVIVAWFEDDGISGDSTEQRAGFQAMHKAACNGRNFDAILVWDQDRFGRFNSLESGFWVHPLMKAGVRLVSVTEGPIDWTNFTGRMMYAMKQEGKHQFLVDLSRNVARGMTSLAQKGFLCGQAAPYGFDRMLVDEQGVQRQRIQAGERVAKPRSWRATLVASADPQKVATVQWLFNTYATTDTGLRSLADQLNARGLTGPSGGAWYAATIKAILENRNYTGTFTWAKRREGKYHSAMAGQIHKRDSAELKLSPRGKPNAIDNPQEAWIVVDDAHEALIDRKLFDLVQERISDRKRSNPGIGYRTHTRANGDAYLLSGLVHCSHCGCKMHGATLRAKGNAYPKYVCSTYQRSGKSNPSGCGCHGVHQDDLVRLIVRKLQERLLGGNDLEKLKAAIRKQLSARAKPDAGKLEIKRKELAELDRQIGQAADNFLRAPADILEMVAGKLSAMKRQREHLEAEIDHLEREAKPRDVEGLVEAAANKAWLLAEDMHRATPARRREVFGQLVARIDLTFGSNRRGKRVECPVISGVIHLSPEVAGIFGCVSRGDSMFTQQEIRFSARELQAA